MSWSSDIKIIVSASGNHKFSLLLEVNNDVVIQQCDLIDSTLLVHRVTLLHLLRSMCEIFCSFVPSLHTSDAINCRQLSHLPETTEVSESTRYIIFI